MSNQVGINVLLESRLLEEKCTVLENFWRTYRSVMCVSISFKYFKCSEYDNHSSQHKPSKSFAIILNSHVFLLNEHPYQSYKYHRKN